MERIFGESDLDCTMMRPPQLTDKPYTGKERLREAHLPLSLSKSRADVDDFMIKVVENPSTIRKVIGVCN
jgi:putative NAD(P)-binding protein